MKRKIIQCFNWELQAITSHLPEIKRAGYTAIQISPITPTKEPQYHEYWRLYQPIAFTIGNYLGTKEEFISLCQAAHGMGLEVYVDVVLRHVAGLNDGRLYPHESVDSKISNRRDYFLPPIECSNYDDRWQSTHRCTGTPTLNYFNEELLYNIVIPFLDEVLKYADGLRVDEAKHLALPYEGAQLWNILSRRYDNKFIYGECIFVDQNLFDDYANYIYVLTNNRPYRNKNKAVVFVESHDDYLTFSSTKWMNDNTRAYEYEKCLKEYDNVLMYARPYDELIFSDEIRRINEKYF